MVYEVHGMCRCEGRCDAVCVVHAAMQTLLQAHPVTKRKVYTHWTCLCGNSIRTEIVVKAVWCTRTLACRRKGGGRPMIEAHQSATVGS